MDIDKLKGTKKVEIPYMQNQLEDSNKSVLVIGERGNDEMISPSIRELEFEDVTTTDIREREEENDWKHITEDFIEFDESLKYDYVVSISVFEHFGFWFHGERMANGLALDDDTCKWNHDLRGITKACKLLKDDDSKLIITLPAGPYMNYEDTGEPFLRYYDSRRQNIVKGVIDKNNCEVVDEKFFYSEDFKDWNEMNNTINSPKYYGAINSYTPNLIWAFTLMKK